jgi:hypothetical protein
MFVECLIDAQVVTVRVKSARVTLIGWFIRSHAHAVDCSAYCARHEAAHVFAQISTKRKTRKKDRKLIETFIGRISIHPAPSDGGGTKEIMTLFYSDNTALKGWFLIGQAFLAHLTRLTCFLRFCHTRISVSHELLSHPIATKSVSYQPPKQQHTYHWLRLMFEPTQS